MTTPRSAPEPARVIGPAVAAAAPPTPEPAAAPAAGDPPHDRPRTWPALFGEPQPPAPPAPPEPEPQPPTPEPDPEPQPPAAPIPPLDSLGYRLNGLVRMGEDIWALVSHPAGERVLRPGDVLQDDLTVERISEEGLWVVNGQGSRALLAFEEER